MYEVVCAYMGESAKELQRITEERCEYDINQLANIRNVRTAKLYSNLHRLTTGDDLIQIGELKPIFEEPGS